MNNSVANRSIWKFMYWSYTNIPHGGIWVTVSYRCSSAYQKLILAQVLLYKKKAATQARDVLILGYL